MSNVEKRSVTTDALETLGKCPIPYDSGRDAIHLAVEPVVAAESLRAGARIGLLPNGQASTKAKKLVGIVDPFISGPIKPGDRFWLVVFPRQITSLRHVWSHPDFPSTTETKEDIITDMDRAASLAWIKAFCERSDCPDPETVLAAAMGEYVEPIEGYDTAYEYMEYGDGEIYLYFSGRDGHSPIPPEFWDHVEIITGQKIPPHKKATHFTCSC